MFRIALAGRPNVGKSSLFNRLLSRPLSLVEDTPGVTRDWISGVALLNGHEVELVDTAGLRGSGGRRGADAASGLERDIQDYNLAACREADLIWFLVDARAGLLPEDAALARELRRLNVPILLVLNKSENERLARAFSDEATALGFGEGVMVSSAHGLGISDLADATLERAGEGLTATKTAPENVTETVTETAPEKTAAAGDETGDESGGESGVRAGVKAVIGRPNVGKSTLVNALLGSERLLVSEIAGTTRDAISVEVGSGVGSLVDTAGLRKRARVSGVLERLAGGRSIAALGDAEQVWLVVDATLGVEKQDLILASRVIREGRSLVVVVNKCDCVASYEAARLDAEERLARSLSQARGVAVVAVSAREGRDLDILVERSRGAGVAWNRRVSTGALNRWLRATVEEHPPPSFSGRAARIKYITQYKARPPSFMVSCSGRLPRSYVRYLENRLRAEFDLHGVPLRLSFSKGQTKHDLRH